MHIYFSGIGGAGISSAALLAHQAGFTVSGSDKQDGSYIHYLQKAGVRDIAIGQSYQHIAATHAAKPIDWFVYTSALTMEQQDAPELRFCREHGIKTSKRDEFLNMLIQKKNQKLIAVAGTHGKSTTTAMIIWLFKELNVPVSYAVGAKMNVGELSLFDPKSEYFVYECDEFDRNFLAFRPYISVITGLAWDHHEIFPTQEAYSHAFRDFISQSRRTILWRSDFSALHLQKNQTLEVLAHNEAHIAQLNLAGRFNREDGWLAIQTVARITSRDPATFTASMNRFPGLAQRMERLAPNVYTNYAHTPEKIKGGMSAAQEIAAPGQKIIVIYEPLTNRRQYFIQNDYKDCFAGAAKLYWVPTYLAREDPAQPVLTPKQLITHLARPKIAEPAELDSQLAAAIRTHVKNGDLVVAMGASGAGSLDEWLRALVA